MIRTMQLAIIKKDLKSIVCNRRLFPILLIVPVVLAILVPTIFVLALHFIPEKSNEFQKMVDLLPAELRSDDFKWDVLGLMLNRIMPTFFMMIPIMASSVMAASSFVGEKEKRTLETLLYCPLSLKQILQSKIIASFAMSMLVSFSSFFAMLLVTETEVFLTTGRFLLPELSWLLVLLLLSPAISILAISLIVRGSAKAKSTEEAQQRAVFLIFPILLLVVGQFTGILLINFGILLILGAVLILVDILLLRRAGETFSYESVLK